jgi:peptidoglycan/LPS O-acetylase OafA/YrhL
VRLSQGVKPTSKLKQLLPVTTKTAEHGGYWRADLQGMRAVALLVMVLYHNNHLLPGGFYGIDIFMVVSGFIITKLLLREIKETGTARLGQFYARRVRRLLPLLALVSVLVTLLSLLVLSPFGEHRAVIDAARSTTLFAGNAHFMLLDDYEALVENPLRHTWSLAVEEQFYLVFPPLLLLTARFARNARHGIRPLLIGVMASVTLLSFASYVTLSQGISMWATSWFSIPSERLAFFMMPARAWEFGVGVLCALAPLSLRRRTWGLLGVAGYVLLIWSIVSDNPSPTYAGLRTLAPVLGTGLLVMAGERHPSVTKVLTHPWLTWVGDRSYGWYLWLWPTIAFTAVLWPSSRVAMAAASVLSLLLAVVSYKYVEQPVRGGARWRGLRTVSLGVACVVLPLSILPVVSVVSHKIARHPFEATEQRKQPWLAEQRDCWGPPKEWSAERCTIGDGTGPRIVLLGDSQAAAMSDAAAAAATAVGSGRFTMATRPGCPFILSFAQSTCAGSAAAAEELLAGDPAIVMIANSGVRYKEKFAASPQATAGSGAGSSGDFVWRRSYVDAVAETVEKLVQAGHRVVLFLEVPTLDFDSRISLLRPTPSIRNVEVEAQKERSALVAMFTEQFAEDRRVIVLDPAPVLCPSGSCSPVVDGVWVYRDVQHVTPYGSLLFEDMLASSFETHSNQLTER